MQFASEENVFTAEDILQLKTAGITLEQAQLQLRKFQAKDLPKLLRPCTLGDGISPLPENARELEEEFHGASVEGRLIHFIPASGAATRMGLGDIPKALAPFHRYGSRIATPVEEHIREAVALAGEGVEARLHFTIAPEHETRFNASLREILKRLRAEGIQTEVTYSLQDTATQTFALDVNGNPFHDDSGKLLLRPGGHGALLSNLEACGAEFAWIHNVDNIAVESHRAKGRSIHRALAGKLIQMAKDRKARNRPLRVCGMVPNTGESGGGPFWISGSDGKEEIRIVEAAEVRDAEPGQAQIFRSASHFNPVDMICALRDPNGRFYPLQEFANQESHFTAQKTYRGQQTLILEWPGLWNGGMAHWDTTCVEIPLSLFTPVKTSEDLLRPEHRGK